MSIRSHKARADRLAEEVLAERRARREHVARAKAIFLRRLASPRGLAVCFGAGAVTGLRRGQAEPAVADRDGGGPENGEEEGFLQRFADSPLGNIAVRLAAATIVQYLLTPGGDGSGDAGGAGESAAADAAGAGG